MRMNKILLYPALCAILCLGGITVALAQDHLKDLDSVRSSMTEIGYKLPDVIKAAKPQDIRTLERVFEINNYALMTIESYLKMLKVFSVAGGYINKEIVGILNGWLNFMSNYCKYDLKYLNDAKSETQDKTAIEIIDKEIDSLSRLMQAAIKGAEENSKILAE
jgi:hypothetical protein